MKRTKRLIWPNHRELNKINEIKTKIEHLQTKQCIYTESIFTPRPVTSKLPELTVDRTGRSQIRIAWCRRIDRLAHHRCLLLQSRRILRGHRLRIVQYRRLNRWTGDRCQIKQRYMEALLLAARLRPFAVRPFVAKQRVVAPMQRHEVFLVLVRLVEMPL